MENSPDSLNLLITINQDGHITDAQVAGGEKLSELVGARIVGCTTARLGCVWKKDPVTGKWVCV